MISSFAKAEQHPPHLAVSYFQPRGCFDLCQMLLLYLVQHFQSVPFSLAQSDPLRFHGPLGPPWKRTSLLCSDKTYALIDLAENSNLISPNHGGLRVAPRPNYLSLPNCRKARWRRHGGGI